MPVTFAPLNDRVMLYRTEAQEKVSKGGLVMATTATQKDQKVLICRVIAVGPGRTSDDGNLFISTQLQIGDTVLVGKFSGEEVEVEGTTYLVLKEDQVLGRLLGIDAHVNEEKAAAVVGG